MNWTNEVIKYVLIVFNFLFLISGIVILTVGISVKAYYYQYETLLDYTYFSIPNLLIATGAIIFIISFFGCFGAIKENWLLIFSFSVLLIAIFVLELSGGIAGYVLRGRTSSFLQHELMDALHEYKENNESVKYTVAWDLIQNTFKCCGVNSPYDWNATEWNRIQPNSTQSVDDVILPMSCCVIKNGVVGYSNCTTNTTSAIINRRGCKDRFGTFLKDHAFTLGAVGLSIAIIQLFGIVFACYLSKKLKEGFYYST